MKYNSKKMKKIEKEYAAMKIKEQEEMVELRVRAITKNSFVIESEIDDYAFLCRDCEQRIKYWSIE